MFGLLLFSVLAGLSAGVMALAALTLREEPRRARSSHELYLEAKDQQCA